MDDRFAEVKKLFEKWNRAVRAGDPDRVVALYAFNAVLVPTLSNEVRTTHDEIRAYFVEFLKKKPRARLDESNVRVYGDIAVNSGIYTFHFGTTKTAAHARYSFVYHWSGTAWLIVEHHSSLLYAECECKVPAAINFFVEPFIR